MKETLPLQAASPAAPRRRSLKTALKAAGLVAFLLLCASAGAALALLGKFYGTSNLGQIITQTNLVLMDPRKSFPGESHINVLCLGLDRNIYHGRSHKDPLNGMPYTRGARSDVMMVASLDLEQGTVSILSIPRDTRVQLPGKHRFAKINQAHADGGIPYTRETVEEFLGIKLDHHVVIKQEAIESIVNALGGLKLNVGGALVRPGVRGDMDYDDNWGNLHVHLKPGVQVVDGKQVVGYMRFRHDYEGDFGRIKRQQQVIQELSQRVKDPSVLLKASGLISAVRQYVQTDLSPTQQLALAHLFHKIDPANVQTAQLPVLDTEMVDNVSYVIPDDYKKEAAVDWLINGNREAMNRLIRVRIKNGSGSRALYEQAYECLRHYGFDVVRAGRVEQTAATHALQHSSLRGAARRVLEVLGLGGSVEKEEGSDADVTLLVGKDLEKNPVLAASDTWPEVPERPVRTAVRRSHRRAEEPVLVKVRAYEPGGKEEEPQSGEPPADEPAPPDSAPSTAAPDEPARTPDSSGGSGPGTPAAGTSPAPAPAPASSGASTGG